MDTLSNQQRPRVLLAEDDTLIRYSLRRIVEKQCDVVAEAADGQVAVDLAQELRPDVILLDVSMPVMRGFEAARLIRHHAPDVRIIMVSNYSDRAYIDEAFRLGVEGFVLKGSALFQLPDAIKDVLAGRPFRPE
jgi:DNA-binding NarL/FixJ family response regulator